MALINGYKYTTESEAQAAQKDCNEYYGIPVSAEDITQNWIDYQFAGLNNPQFWYIYFDESLEVVLGEPTEFEVIMPEPETIV
jgi:hypothetical protein